MSEQERNFETLEDQAVMYDEAGKEFSAHRHRNPDGSIGGWVAESSTVDPSSWIDPRAVVMPGAVVAAGARITGTEIVH